MNRRLAALIALFLLLTICGNAQSTKTNDDREVQFPSSFYVAIHRVSDASPFWFDYVIDAHYEGEKGRITVLRVAPLDGRCADIVTVKAKEAVLPADRLRKLSRGVCEVDATRLERALNATMRKGAVSIFEAESYGIVARCGDAELVLGLPMIDVLNDRRLHKRYPDVYRLWELPGVLLSAVFNGNPLGVDDVEVDAESQRTAEQYLPKLRSGAFDKGFLTATGKADPWSEVLAKYRGVVTSRPLFGEALNKESLDFQLYVPAKFPRIALSARIAGDVQVRFRANSSSGKVEEILSSEGPPMLRQAAEDTVRQWVFNLPLRDNPLMQTTIRFGPFCPAKSE